MSDGTPQHVLGFDLGGTNLRAALAEVAGGAVLAELSEPAVDVTGPSLATRVAALADKLGADTLAAACVGVPGPIGTHGRVGPTVNLAGLSGVPVRALIEEKLGVQVVVENDVNLAALGEYRHGRGAGADDLVFVAVGTGVGMGIVAGGEILRGARGGAGELGLLPMGPGRVPTNLDELGPLEAVAGGAGLAARWSEHTGRPASGREVFAAAEAGERFALQLLEDQAAALAMGVRAVQAILDPTLVVFGGGIGVRQDVVARVQAVLVAHGLPLPEIAVSALGERAGVIGAVAAALQAAGNADPVQSEA